MIKVLIVDDQKILLDGIAELFHGSDLVTVVGSITLPDLVEIYCSRKAPDLVLAQALGIAGSTVNFHINNMLTKTGHKNIVGLAVEAANRGYIDPEVGE